MVLLLFSLLSPICLSKNSVPPCTPTPEILVPIFVPATSTSWTQFSEWSIALRIPVHCSFAVNSMILAFPLSNIKNWVCELWGTSFYCIAAVSKTVVFVCPYSTSSLQSSITATAASAELCFPQSPAWCPQLSAFGAKLNWRSTSLPSGRVIGIAHDDAHLN